MDQFKHIAVPLILLTRLCSEVRLGGGRPVVGGHEAGASSTDSGAARKYIPKGLTPTPLKQDSFVRNATCLKLLGLDGRKRDRKAE